MDPNDPKRRHLENRLRFLAVFDEALEDRVAVLKLIAEAEDRDRARELLMTRYGWETVEANAVLDLQFRRATLDERKRIDDERREIQHHLDSLQ